MFSNLFIKDSTACSFRISTCCCTHVVYMSGVHEWCTAIHTIPQEAKKDRREDRRRTEGERKGGRREDRRINGTQSVRVRSEPEMKED